MTTNRCTLCEQSNTPAYYLVALRQPFNTLTDRYICRDCLSALMLLGAYLTAPAPRQSQPRPRRKSTRRGKRPRVASARRGRGTRK